MSVHPNEPVTLLSLARNDTEQAHFERRCRALGLDPAKTTQEEFDAAWSQATRGHPVTFEGISSAASVYD